MFFGVQALVATSGKTERKSMSAFFLDGLRDRHASLSSEAKALSRSFFIGTQSADRSLVVNVGVQSMPILQRDSVNAYKKRCVITCLELATCWGGLKYTSFNLYF